MHFIIENPVYLSYVCILIMSASHIAQLKIWARENTKAGRNIKEMEVKSLELGLSIEESAKQLYEEIESGEASHPLSKRVIRKSKGQLKLILTFSYGSVQKSVSFQ